MLGLAANQEELAAVMGTVSVCLPQGWWRSAWTCPTRTATTASTFAPGRTSKFCQHLVVHVDRARRVRQREGGASGDERVLGSGRRSVAWPKRVDEPPGGRGPDDHSTPRHKPSGHAQRGAATETQNAPPQHRGPCQRPHVRPGPAVSRPCSVGRSGTLTAEYSGVLLPCCQRTGCRLVSTNRSLRRRFPVTTSEDLQASRMRDADRESHFLT